MKQPKYVMCSKINVPVSHIKAVVAHHFEITVGEMESRARAKVINKARQIAITLCYSMNDISTSTLAKSFKRGDHTTICHAVTTALRLYQDEVNQLAKAVAETPRGFMDKDEPPPVIAVPVLDELRADKFTPRRGFPARVIHARPRAVNVTGALLGDPGYASLRVMRGETSKGE